MYKFRDYQQKLYDLIVEAYRKAISLKKKLSAIIVSPTRSGKTIIFSNLAKKLEESKRRVYVLTHRKEIFDQTFEKINSPEIGLHAGQIRPGKALTSNLIQVGMIRTVRSILRKQDRIRECTNGE